MKKLFYLFALVGSLMLASCNPEPKPAEVTFAIGVSDITATSALVTVTPSDTNALYYFDLFSQEVYDEFETPTQAAEDLLQYILDGVEEYQEYGYDVELVDWLSQGQDHYEFSTLSPETSYVVVAFRVDTATSAVVGTVYHEAFTTHPVEQVDLTFNTEVTDTAIWFVPNLDEVEYFATFIDADTLQAYGVTATEYFEYLVTYYGEYIEYFTMHGPIYVELSELNPGSDYVFLAQAYTGGVWNSDLFAGYFSAPTDEPAEIAPSRQKMSFNHKVYKKMAKRLTIENNKIQKL